MRSTSYRDFLSKLPKFTSWLAERGASVLTPTNEWELARWAGAGVTSVVYTDKKHNLTFTGASLAAWIAFCKGDTAYRVAPAAKRAVKSSPTVKALRKRDGNRCFFCGNEVDDEQASVEHLVPVTHGGPSHMSNYVLAHRSCNANAGHLSAMEKIKRHIAARGEA